MTQNVQTTTAVTDPLKMTETYVRALNTGDANQVLALYAPDAISIWEPGHPVSGDDHEAKLRAYIDRKPVIDATVRESYVAGDAALLVVDWTLDIPASLDADAEHHAGIGLDVLRKNNDEHWHYVIDNPFGQA